MLKTLSNIIKRPQFCTDISVDVHAKYTAFEDKCTYFIDLRFVFDYCPEADMVFKSLEYITLEECLSSYLKSMDALRGDHVIQSLHPTIKSCNHPEDSDTIGIEIDFTPIFTGCSNDVDLEKTTDAIRELIYHILLFMNGFVENTKDD